MTFNTFESSSCQVEDLLSIVTSEAGLFKQCCRLSKKVKYEL